MPSASTFTFIKTIRSDVYDRDFVSAGRFLPVPSRPPLELELWFPLAIHLSAINLDYSYS